MIKKYHQLDERQKEVAFQYAYKELLSVVELGFVELGSPKQNEETVLCGAEEALYRVSQEGTIEEVLV